MNTDCCPSCSESEGGSRILIRPWMDLCVLRVLYVQPREEAQGSDKGCFRERAKKLVAGSWLCHGRLGDRRENLGWRRQDARTAGRRPCGRADRSICAQRLDLVTKQ